MGQVMKFNKRRYSTPQVAKKLGVHEQTIRYWTRKGWIKPKRDYRNYPIFTDEDINNIKEWMNRIDE